MTLVADSNGIVKGKFTIPENIPAGAKNVLFTGAGGSTGGAVFFGQGELDEITSTLVTQRTGTVTGFIQNDILSYAWFVNSTDPIAQTFTVRNQMQIDAVDLFFTEVGNTDVAVEIRATQVGFPTRETLAYTRLKASSITPGEWTKFTFEQPTRLDAGIEYAIVVLCNDPVSELAVAELGKFDPNTQQWVTSQPYTVGVLLSSSNASTWTAYQDRDLAFRLYARHYTQTDRVVDMGTVTLDGATDLLLRTIIEVPSAGTWGQIEISLPDGRVVASADGQNLRFTVPITGDVNVQARLRATEWSSAALYPGTQLIEGHQRDSAIYVSDAIDADAAGSTVRVIFDAAVPSGATIAAHVSGVGAGDPWIAMSSDGPPKLLDGNLGLYEYSFRVTAMAAARVRGRITIAGTPAARPYVRNFRLFTM